MQSFRIIKPSDILSPYIHHFWILKDTGPENVTERVTPIGCMQIVFHRGCRLNTDNDNTIQPQSFVGGQAMTFYDVRSTGNLDMIVAVLQPYAGRFFLHQSANLFMNAKISTDDTSDIELKELANRIIEDYDDLNCIRKIEKFFIQRLYDIPDYEVKKWQTVQWLINNTISVDITKLADVACLSERQFRRTFNENFGISPKQFLRTIRMQRALSLLEHTSDITFAQLAYSCGFSDQSHMIKEFRTFSGYTPEEYIAICPPVSDYFSE